jgi:hypothetical protein
VQTIIETPSYLAAAKQAGMSEAEMRRVVDLLAANPDLGDVISGTGGCCKLRFAKPGKGKSGRYRIITFFSGPERPVFLLTVFGKSEKDNLTKAQRNSLAGLTSRLKQRIKK